MLSFASRLRGYTPALLALVAACLIHAFFASTTGAAGAAVFCIYLGALLIAAWCGYGPGYLVLFLALLVIPYGYRRNFDPLKTDPIGAGVLLLLSTGVSAVSASRRRTEIYQAAEIEAAHEDMRRQLAQLESLYSKLPVGICFLDNELRYVRINEKLAAINGASPEEHTRRRFHEMAPPDIAGIEPRMRQVLETGAEVSEWEIASQASESGSDAREWMITCSRVETLDGNVLGLQVIVQDITERKRAERALSRANADLTQFAYVAAHDLQEPLRTVVTFSQLALRTAGDSIGPEAEGHLNRVVDSAKRMGYLIRDVLSYSRATSDTDIQEHNVRVDDVLASVLEALAARIEETGARITRGTMPVVRGDPARLAQVFQNLIDNALKYRRPDVVPEISIRAALQDSEWLFSVEDNGEGFQPKYADRVFGIFKRLHGHDIPGSGIGLAICKAVVERHGGRMWAESEAGRGATFRFTLPATRAGSSASA